MGAILNQRVVDAFQQGDQDAFTEIFHHYYGSLVRFTKKLTGSVEEGEDIAIDVFTTLFHRRSAFNNADNIRAFLFVTARNNCLGYLKKVGSLPDQKTAFEIRMKDDDTFQYEYEEISVIRKEVIECIGNMSEEEGKVFWMRYRERKKTAEIAAKLGMSADVVCLHKTNAIQALKKAAGENGKTIAWLLIMASCAPNDHFLS
jgi:RNA polymerase sigma factor (sigma-70 family)